MASSSYYYNLYKKYKKEVEELEKNIKSLTEIRNGISSNYYDEQSAVNKELNDLKEDLQKSIRHDSLWNNIALQCETYKEKASSADSNLRSSMDCLDSEIQSLNAKKNTAIYNRDQAYKKYLEKKDEERKERLKKLKSLI